MIIKWQNFEDNKYIIKINIGKDIGEMVYIDCISWCLNFYKYGGKFFPDVYNS